MNRFKDKVPPVVEKLSDKEKAIPNAADRWQA
jgi:hypothetical protein